VNVERARRVAAVAAVLTGHDLLGWPGLQPTFGPVFRDRPVLAFDTVRYVGDPVVAVAAVDADTVREAHVSGQAAPAATGPYNPCAGDSAEWCVA
jgi:CO/xanthine dehydrogenase Mo-binding subunit